MSKYIDFEKIHGNIYKNINVSHEKISGNDNIGILKYSISKFVSLKVFSNLKKDNVINYLLHLSVPHTYIFGRLVIPGFMENICKVLRSRPPVDTSIGNYLYSCTQLFLGEICTNNIFYIKGQKHAHYYDLVKCYESAGLDMDEVQKFHELDKEYGIEKAMNLSTLWSPELANYYNKVDECVSNPLSTFLLIWAMEFSIPSTYHLMLDSFNESVKYNDFKVFLEKHIGHDECDHGPATLEWLNILLVNNNYSNKEIGDAILSVSEVFNTRVSTYNKLESIFKKH